MSSDRESTTENVVDLSSERQRRIDSENADMMARYTAHRLGRMEFEPGRAIRFIKAQTRACHSLGWLNPPSELTLNTVTVFAEQGWVDAFIGLIRSFNCEFAEDPERVTCGNHACLLLSNETGNAVIQSFELCGIKVVPDVYLPMRTMRAHPRDELVTCDIDWKRFEVEVTK